MEKNKTSFYGCYRRFDSRERCYVPVWGGSVLQKDSESKFVAFEVNLMQFFSGNWQDDFKVLSGRLNV